MMGKTWSDERVKSELASLAERELAVLDAKLSAILEGVDREWPDAICNSEVPPSVAFLLFSAVEALRESTKEAVELARAASEYDEEAVLDHWRRIEKLRVPG